MRAVIQRVSEAAVTANGQHRGSIGKGLLVLLGIEEADTEEDIRWLSSKITNIRLFNDELGVMNKSVLDIHGELILVSQFTLHASTKKGNRPSYIKAARPVISIPLYEKMIVQLEHDLQKPVITGVFGADMKVNLINDGPVTIIIDTKQKE